MLSHLTKCRGDQIAGHFTSRCGSFGQHLFMKVESAGPRRLPPALPAHHDKAGAASLSATRIRASSHSEWMKAWTRVRSLSSGGRRNRHEIVRQRCAIRWTIKVAEEYYPPRRPQRTLRQPMRAFCHTRNQSEPVEKSMPSAVSFHATMRYLVILAGLSAWMPDEPTRSSEPLVKTKR